MNLSDIELIKGSERDRRHYSFVGIERNKQSGQLEFWLPLGFEDFPEDDFTALKTFFFKMYRTLSIYFKRRSDSPLEEGEERETDRDGFYQSDKGFSFQKEDQEEIVLFSKISALDKIIEGYDDLRIAALERKIVRTEEIDYSKIHRYLHQAVYLEDDVIYLDEMRIPKGVITASSPPLVQMFCFIYAEIKREIRESDSVPDHVHELAEQFKEHFLQPDTQLFGSPEMLNQSVATMKEVLEDIETGTVYKDEDFWHFFEAVEAFLYAERDENEEGIYWGISNFYDVWEDMCRVFILSNEGDAIYNLPHTLFIDMSNRLTNLKGIFPNPFSISFPNTSKIGIIRPDLVMIGATEILRYDNFFEKLYTIEEVIIEKENGEEKEELELTLVSEDWRDVDSIRQELLRKYNSNPIDPYDYDTVRKHDVEEQHGFNLKMKAYKFLMNLEQEQLIERNPRITTPTLELLERISTISEIGVIRIIDFKYMAEVTYQDYNPQAIDHNGENKIRTDIQKQLIYEWTTQQNIKGCHTKSEFWIPYYNPVQGQSFEESRNPRHIQNAEFNKSQIEVVKIDFTLLQDIYLAHGLQQSLR